MTGYMPVPGVDFDPAVHHPAPVDHPRLTAAAATQWGVDYAWQSNTFDQLAALLTSNGTQFACRYLNDAVPGGKGLTVNEAKMLIAAGIIIVPVWETTGVDFTGGYSAGLAAGQAAAARMRVLGVPAGSFVYFAIDADTSDFTSTDNYLIGAKDGTGAYVAQLYGSFAVVEAAASAGLGNWHWQTYAWSAGRISAHAGLYQYQNAVSIGGISMDRDRTLQAISGPWLTFAAVPVPAHPVLRQGDSGVAVATLQRRLIAWGAVLAADGIFGLSTFAAVKVFQGARVLSVDGICGPGTWAALLLAPCVPGQLPPPTGLVIDRKRVPVQWNPVPGAAVTGYQCVAYGNDGNEYARASTSRDVTWCVLDGLAPGGTYTVRVWADGGKVAPSAAEIKVVLLV